MSRAVQRASLLALLLSLVSSATSVTARPPDLPVNTNNQCVPQEMCPLAEPQYQECLDFDFGGLAPVNCPCDYLTWAGWWEKVFDLVCGREGLSGPVAVFQDNPAFTPGYVPCPPMTCPVDVATRARVQKRISKVVSSTTAPTMPKEVGEVLRQLSQARRVFQMGERYQRAGQMDLACACYQECHLLFPTSTYAQVALQRLAQFVQARRALEDATEEAEPRDEEQADADDGSEQACEKRSKFRLAVGLFSIGERCWQQGDLDMAFSCFNEVVHICPNDNLVETARRKLNVIRALREVTTSEPVQETTPAEESQPTKPPTDSSRLRPGQPTFETSTFRSLEQLCAEVQRTATSAPTVLEVIESSKACPRACSRTTTVEVPVRPRRICLACTEDHPSAAEVQRWFQGVQRALGVAGPLEIDIDCTRPDSVRYHGRLWFGLVGIQVQGEQTPSASKTYVGWTVLP